METSNLIAKVNRSAFLKLRQDAMLTKSEDILQRMSGVEKYALIENIIEDFNDRVDTFRSALVKANNGGKILTANKNIAKQALMEEFGELANALDYYAKGNVSFILDAGLECQQKRRSSNSSGSGIFQPINVVIKPTNIEGCIDISFELINRNKILNVGVEWRIVGETTWNNGTYLSGLSGQIKDLPSLIRIEVKLRSIGRGDVKSEWTIPITVPVL